jgi:VanZ family protein
MRHPVISATIAYTVLLVYGTLYPLQGWRVPTPDLLTLFAASLTGQLSRADMLTNVLVYMPLGLLLAWSWRARLNTGVRLVLCTAAGLLLSTSLEITQAYLPERMSSLMDIALNAAGTFLGALLPTALSDNNPLGSRWLHWRRDWIHPDIGASVGLMALGLWVLSQTFPFVPSIDIANLRQGLSPLWQTLHHPTSLDLGKTAAYATSVCALGLVAFAITTQPRRRVHALFAVLVAGVLAAKVPIIHRQLSLEAIVGVAFGLVVLYAGHRSDPKALRRFAAIALLAAYVTEQLRPGSDSVANAFGWQLFAPQMLTINGLADILEGSWPFMGLAAMALLAAPRLPAATAWVGVLGVLGITTVLETAQGFVPGRYPEVTDIVVAVVAWTMPWLFASKRALTATEASPSR